MKLVLAILFAAILMASAAIAAGPKDYQVTGPVLDLNDDVITVQGKMGKRAQQRH